MTKRTLKNKVHNINKQKKTSNRWANSMSNHDNKWVTMKTKDRKQTQEPKETEITYELKLGIYCVISAMFFFF